MQLTERAKGMEPKDLLSLYQKYLKDDPNLAVIMEQLGIDQEEYLKSMQVIQSSMVVSNKPLSNSTVA
jgi:DNA-directed RNA polymerase specialized sigma subunit